MISLPEKRIHAFLFHLLGSAFIFLIFLYVLYFHWYPGPFIYFGALHGIQLVGGVDLVLGPLLTLVVYNKYKKTIRMDLAIIFTLQIACLIAGLWLVYQQRPMLQVFKLDTLHLITHYEAKKYKMDLSELAEIPGPYPKFVWLDLPSDKKTVRSIELAYAMSEEAIEANTELYIYPKDLAPSEIDSHLSQTDFNNVEIISSHAKRHGKVDILTGLLSIHRR